MSLTDRIDQVRERVAAAAQRAGRTPDEVTIVAVSKTHPIPLIEEAYAAGLRHFGENRVYEGIEKIDEIGEQLPDIRWHMIGHIQSRKTNEIDQGVFDWIHSIDRFKVARRLSAGAPDNVVHKVLVEVNLSGEESKYGYRIHDEAAFFAAIEKLLTLPGIAVRGLMTLAPYTDDPEQSRPIFRQLAALRETLAQRFPQATWDHLSMGMSADFEVAIEEGATMIRPGTIIFGERHYH